MYVTRRLFMIGSLTMTLKGTFAMPAIANSKGARTTGSTKGSRPSTRSMSTAKSMITNSKKTNGHLTRHHVGRSRSYLKTRAAAPPVKSAFKDSSQQGTKGKLASKRPAKRKEFSTFKDEKAAQLALARAIERNRKVLRTMLKEGYTRKTIRTPVPKSAGVVYKTKSKTFASPTYAVFPMRRVGRRILPVTGYLTSERK